jgi:cytochrome c
MGFLDNVALSPSAEHIALLKAIITLMLVIHIPYVSIVMGGAFFSFVFSALDKRESNPTHVRFSRELIELVTSKRSAPALLGILPLFTLILAFSQLYQDSGFRIANYLLIVALLAVAGFVLLYIYRGSFSNRDRQFPLHILFGLGAVLAFFGGYIILASTTSLIFFPEKWSFVNTPFPLFIYENEIPRHGMFLFFTFALTGAAILYFYFSWPERKKDLDPDYANFVKKFATILALVSVFLQPIFIAWNLLTFPDAASSETVFAVWGVTLFMLMVISMLLYSSLNSANQRFSAVVFILFLATFIVMTVNDQIAAGNANFEREKLLAKKAEEIHQQILAAREGRQEAATQVDGTEVFNRICVACHTFDTRLVGPPYMSVLPKYVDNEGALMEFIMNPAKIDPDYPPMPNQGVKKAEATAVAEYLMGEFAKRQ